MAISRNGVRGYKFVQHAVFEKFIHKDYNFFTDSFFGSLGAQATRLADAFPNYGEMTTLAIPKQIVIVVAGIAVIAWQSPLLAAITLLAMVLVLSVTLLSTSWRLKYRRRTAMARSEVAAHIGDALSHGIEVKSFAMEGYEQKRLNEPLAKWGKAQFTSWVAAAPADNARMIMAAIATVVLLIFSAQLYMQGAIDIAIVVLIQLYVIRLVASTLEISELVKRYEEVMAAAYEPMKTMLIPQHIHDPEKPQRLKRAKAHTLSLTDVSFEYPDAKAGRQAVCDITLKIQPGEKIGVVGYSGSGKTTLTKLLLRYMDVTDGSIAIDDIDIRQLKQADLRRTISYVPQEPLLFHRSIAENIMYGNPKASQKAMLSAAQQAYVDEFVKDMPQGYDTLVGERGVKLSGGQRQRVAIARALLKDSPILVLDEATSALDSQSEQYIQQALWQLMEGRTALVIAHRLSTIQRMDKIVVMDKGTIVQVGTHEELKKQKGIYADLWNHQSDGYIGATQDEATEK